MQETTLEMLQSGGLFGFNPIVKCSSLFDP